MLPILISSVVSHTVSTEFYSNDPLLQSTVGGIGNFYEIPLLAVLGIIAALVASFYMRGLTGKLPIPKKNSHLSFTSYSWNNLWSDRTIST